MMLGARTAAWGGKALPYDAEVEWIGKGELGNYIDTGVEVLPDTHYQIKSRLSTIIGSENYAIGQTVLLRNTCCAGAYFNYNSLRIGYRSNFAAGVSVDLSGVNEYFADYQPNMQTISVNGSIVVRASQPSVIAGGGNIAIGKRGAAEADTNTKYYYVSIIVDGKLVRDLIPVRFTNNRGESEGAMYNRLGVGGMNYDGTLRHDGLYINRGNGAFIIGPDKTT